MEELKSVSAVVRKVTFLVTEIAQLMAGNVLNVEILFDVAN